MPTALSKTILLTGRTGNGKSSTGNSLLGHLIFNTAGGSSIGDVKILQHTGTVLGYHLTVIDGSGIGDTGEDMACKAGEQLESVRAAIPKGGFNVLVFVLKYGVRFTKQEMDAVQRVKDIFGEDVFKTRGVIVMTYGDNFELDNEDDDMPFKDWCKNQKGGVEKLIQECNYRCVLFNNKSKNKTKIQEEFLYLVDQIQCSTFTIANFEACSREHTTMLLRESLKQYKQDLDTFLRHFRAKIDAINELPKLTEAREELTLKLSKVTNEDKGTGILNPLIDTLSFECKQLDVTISCLQQQGSGRSRKGLLLAIFVAGAGFILSWCGTDWLGYVFTMFSYTFLNNTTINGIINNASSDTTNNTVVNTTDSTMNNTNITNPS